MTVKLLTEQRLEFLSLEGGCTGSFVSTLVKMPHCLKSYVAAHYGDANFLIIFRCFGIIEFSKWQKAEYGLSWC